MTNKKNSFNTKFLITYLTQKFSIMANTSTNFWDQMVLFNQLNLRNILNGCEDLGTAELKAAVAALTNEQQYDKICFCMHDNKELAGLPDDQGI